ASLARDAANLLEERLAMGRLDDVLHGHHHRTAVVLDLPGDDGSGPMKRGCEIEARAVTQLPVPSERDRRDRPGSRDEKGHRQPGMAGDLSPDVASQRQGAEECGGV